MSWDELDAATASFHRGPRLHLDVKNSLDRDVDLEPRLTGSDPNEVAAIINHFLEHPEDRHLLTDPRAAIERVEQAREAAYQRCKR